MQQLLASQDTIEATLETLSIQHCTAFAAACYERLASCYEAFTLAHQWSGFNVVQSCLDVVWESLLNSKLEQHKLENLLVALEEATPELDNYKTIYAPQAVFAIDAFSSLLQYCLTREAKHNNKHPEHLNIPYRTILAPCQSSLPTGHPTGSGGSFR